MDKYAPELSVPRLKRRCDDDDDDQEHSHYPPAKKTMQTPPPPSNFMRLPAELRNRVYGYAVAEAPSRLLIPVEGFQLQQCHDRRATGIAFTQVSRQIRFEHRPIWLKHATFIIVWHSVHAFLMAFYPSENEYGSGPKKLVLQYDQDHDLTLRQPTEITHLLRLGLSFTGLQMRFIEDEDSDNYEKLGRYFTDLVQFGRISHPHRHQETIEVTEARHKWRCAILDRKIIGLSTSLSPANSLLEMKIYACESFRVAMGPSCTLEKYDKEIGIMVLLKTVFSEKSTTTVALS